MRRTSRTVSVAVCTTVAVLLTLLAAKPAAAVPPTPPDGTYKGSIVGGGLARPVVGVAVTPSAEGYWTVASDGGIFAFGDAAFRGSTGAIALNKPIVGMASTPSGGGYWLVASDGGIFAFGDAAFRGSTGALTLNQPIVGMASNANGSGYWLVAADGGIFAFNATFFGAMGGRCLPDRVVGIATSKRGEGYRLAGRDGLVYAFPGGASYNFESEGERCRPARWNPCAPIAYVINPTGGPANAVPLAQAAVDRLARATGLSFRFEGTTDEAAGPRREIVQPRYGPRFAPLLIAWVDASTIGGAAGLGGVHFIGTASAPVQAVTGFAFVARSLSTFGSDNLQTGVLLHELGHAIGLDHADDTLQVMNSVGDAGLPLTGYIDGDLAGLDRLGRAAGCLTPIQVR